MISVSYLLRSGTCLRACNTVGTSEFVLLLEHSLDLSMISTCEETHRSWPKTLLVLMTDVISKGSESMCVCHKLCAISSGSRCSLTKV